MNKNTETNLIAWGLFLLAVGISLYFCFIVYPAKDKARMELYDDCVKHAKDIRFCDNEYLIN